MSTARPFKSARLRCEALEDRTTPALAYALSGTSLLAFDTAAPTTTTTTAITGITAGETLVGIDVRPQNGLLYGLGVNAATGTENATLYAISTRTGVAGVVGTTGGVAFTTNGTTAVDLPDPATTGYGFDFNPAADRIRVVAGALNFRVDPNTGLGVDGDLASGSPVTGTNPDGPITGGTTTVDAAAYTNNAPNNGNITTLYTLDAVGNSLQIQSNPNGGTQGTPTTVTLGGATLDFTAINGFDIPAGVSAGANNAAVTTGSAFALLTVGGVTRLYSINLVNAQATLIGNLGSGTTAVQGFAVQSDLGGIPAVALDATGLNLLRFNTASPGTVTSAALSGVTAGETLVGIDYRPATGQLYAIGVNAGADAGTLYLVSPQNVNGGVDTASATAVGTFAFVQADGTTAVDLPPASAGYGFDFNPTVDRIRVTTGTGLNFRLTPVPVSGSVAVDGNLNNTTTPPSGTNTDAPINGLPAGSTGVSAAAYTSSFGTGGNPTTPAGVTTLYTLDATSDSLFIQNSANGGTETARLPITLNGSALDFTDANGFDIPAGVRATANNAAVTSGFGYAALTVGGTTRLYRIDLTTGVAALVGNVGAGTTGLAGFTLADAPAGTVVLTGATFSAAEGGSVAVTLTRTGGAVGAVSVTVTATNGTATAGSDFTAGPYTVTLPDGATGLTLNIPLATDALTEGSETFTLTLSAPTNGAALGTQQTATVTITDVPPTTPPVTPGPAGFVERLYRDILGRSPDAAGLQAFNAQLAAGVPRATIAAGFVNSPEGRAKAINALYQQYLGRDADSAGLAGFVGGGQTLTQVAAALVGSAEFFVRSGLTNDGFVTAAYQRILGRAPDAGGRAAFTAALAAGVSRAQVAQVLLTSSEGAAKLVNGLFNRFLGRNADAAALAGFASFYQSTRSVEGVIIAITSSPEYFQKTT